MEEKEGKRGETYVLSSTMSGSQMRSTGTLILPRNKRESKSARKEGRKEGRMEGRKKGKKEGRKEGRKPNAVHRYTDPVKE